MGMLRLILALGVVVAHSGTIFGLRFTDGRASVQLFYLISGFYMSLILHEKYTGPGSYRLFFTNRVLKLMPTYWVVLVASVLVGALLSSIGGIAFGAWAHFEAHAQLLHASNLVPLVASNVAILGQDLVMFTGMDPVSGALFWTADFRQHAPQTWLFLAVPQAWTLSLELTFYMLAPLLVRRRVGVVLALVGASLALRLVLAAFGLGNDPWSYRFFPSELALFLSGSLAYRLSRSPRFTRFGAGRTGRVLLVTFIVGVIGHQFLPPHELTYWSTYAFAVFAIPLLFNRTRAWAWDRRLGELSYPVYIVHWLVVTLLNLLYARTGLQPPDGCWGLVPAVISIAAAWALLRLVVEPIDRLRQARVATAPSPSVAL